MPAVGSCIAPLYYLYVCINCLNKILFKPTKCHLITLLLFSIAVTQAVAASDQN